METPSTENPEQPVVDLPNDVDHHRPLAASSPLEDRKLEPEVSEEEVRGVLEDIATTGKFWKDWEKLKSMLLFQLKQVLSEYPEARMNDEEQSASLGETYLELAKRLDAAVNSFEEGPPFTLQRLCEILLAAKSIYPKLSKLALALEKNLLVTSTLSMSTDPYPQALQKADESDKLGEEAQCPSNSVENGVEPMVGDKDVEMTEVEEAEMNDVMTVDMEAFEDVVGSSETNSTLPGNS